ncbi:galactosylgalactosylxylosylprotein 3-beta-glucuronosyltransferase 3-like [Hydra vulgaris]|uniref:galactosylgalactosylxylosylprotein 3-beta-glucuronosyltransferase 3-like n=1 Tax=Hydra vulgaris TaxID=6087 RepID=UPI0032EA3EB5
MIWWFQRKVLLFPAVIVCCLFIVLYALCRPGNSNSSIKFTVQEIESLKKQLNAFELKLKKKELKTIYLVTPTYHRLTQQADLVRMSNTLKLVESIHWIVIEDSNKKTDLVKNILEDSSIKYTQLYVSTSNDLVRLNSDPRWKKHRGVDQRNLGLKWLRENITGQINDGVVYFADDDNTYHEKLFMEMRNTKKVSMWPVALVGGLNWEGPVCKNGKVVSFYTAWEPNRMFPVDMAAFAINLHVILENNNVYINPEVKRGYLETDFLERLGITKDEIEAKAEDCQKILVWHTQTSEPNMKNEIKLQSLGPGSNPKIVV